MRIVRRRRVRGRHVARNWSVCVSLRRVRGSRDLFVSGEAVVAVDADLRVASWNSATEELTGLSAEEALGQPCFLVLRGQSSRGALLCHRDCSITRYARRGYPVPRQSMTIATTSGPRIVSVSTVTFRDRPEPLLLHVLQDGEQVEVDTPRPQEPPTRLTARQHQVLKLLAEGVTARRIADRLGLAEATVRNHIRAVLSELGAHSQLEAVARARAQGLV